MTLPVYTITNNVRDLPKHVVVRIHYAGADGVRADPNTVAFPHDPNGDDSQALERARAYCRSKGLVRFERAPDDDPVIVECWL